MAPAQWAFLGLTACAFAGIILGAAAFLGSGK
jgi:hypothetical protein